MTDREKLVWLLDKVDVGRLESLFIADHLISNGVTVRQWIPVTERLPEDGCRCLAISTNPNICLENHIMLAWYSPGRGFEDCEADCMELPCEGVTHWMQLPEAPGEEQP